MGDKPATVAPSSTEDGDLCGLTEAQIIASGYTVEDFKRRIALARETVRRGNESFARLKRRF